MSQEVVEAAAEQHGLFVSSSMQESAEAERERWLEEWAVCKNLLAPDWNGSQGMPPPPPLVAEHFTRALMSFPTGLGLGWEALHPRALLRPPHGNLLAIMQLLSMCEQTGR